MFIQEIISYGNAWNNLVEHYPQELAEMMASIADLTPENIAAAQPLRDVPHHQEPGITRYRLDGCWTTSLQSRGWTESIAAVRSVSGRPIHMRGLGYLKGRVSLTMTNHRELLNRWLYRLAPIATRNDYVEIPVAVVLMQPAEDTLFGRRPIIRGSFERTKEELLALSPLSHGNPFVLIGISMEKSDLQICEIESEGDGMLKNIVINRSIEFPPEYHQAGLGILNYFGTVLREKCPEHNTKVRIEQEGLCVRLVIESDNGDKEVIEKALQDYELVIRGETTPEAFFEEKARVLELKNELRIAQVRIESQKDIIAYQGEEIASLRQLFGHSLTATKSQPLSICVNPIINLSANSAVQLQQSLPEISEYVQDLASLAANDPDIELRLLDLDDSISALVKKSTPETVRDSSGMRKLKSVIDDAAETGSGINTFLNKVSDGIDLIQKLARRYNDIAAWCGAPQVPPILLGNQS